MPSSAAKPPLLILANPTAGARALRATPVRALDAAKRDLEKSGFAVHLVLETDPRAVRERAENAARAGAPIIIAAGGDGTVNSVANGILAASGGTYCPTQLGVIPLGTGNVFARNLSLGRNWREACAIIRAGNTRRIDAVLAQPMQQTRPARRKRSTLAGRPSPRYFLLMAGIGFDAKVIEETSLRLKFLLRDFAYAFTSLQNAVVHQGTQVTLTFPDGTRHSQMAWLLMAGNAASYAWAIKFTEKAELDDGKLDLCLFPFENKLTSVQQVMQLLMGQHVERGSAQYFHTTGVRIESTPPIPIQLDGDEWGTTPVELSILPGVLEVLAPPAFATPALTHAHDDGQPNRE